jgi:hypothetical protein
MATCRIRGNEEEDEKEAINEREGPGILSRRFPVQENILSAYCTY